MGKWLLLILFGKGYDGSWDLALILVVASTAHALMRVLSNFMAGMGKPGKNTITLMTEILSLLVSIPVATHAYGVEGLCIAAALSASMSFGVSLLQCCREMNCSPLVLLVPRIEDLRKVSRRMSEALRRFRRDGPKQPPFGVN
jgi:hypothetical protein